jgi:hypothetical protein
MLLLELGVCGGVCFNGCVAMNDGDRIVFHSYCHERPEYNDSLRSVLFWVRTLVMERGFSVSSYPSRPAVRTHLGLSSTFCTEFKNKKETYASIPSLCFL